MISIGLDLSLAKTGVVILEDGNVIFSGLVKSPPQGSSPLQETIRIIKIADQIDKIIKDNLGTKDPSVVMIENLAFMARNTTALTQLAGLNHLVRTRFVTLGWPFVMVAPSSLKKFITSKGNSDKNLMMMVVFRDYGFESIDDNECDAYSLAICGNAVLGCPTKTLNKQQKEVVSLLKTQYGKT